MSIRMDSAGRITRAICSFKPGFQSGSNSTSRLPPIKLRPTCTHRESERGELISVEPVRTVEIHAE
jgi:hypothetical protein